MNWRAGACATWLLLASGAVAAEPPTLTVFAAASLAAPLRELGHEFEQAEPGVRVRLNLAGSQQLVAQLRQGADADVFASADERTMAVADSSGLLAAPSVTFAHNALAVIVPRANRARLTRLEDLARPGIKLVIGADAVPVGHYTRVLLAKLAPRQGYPAGYARRVLANVVSEEENVRAVLNKVQLGEADAGVVYRSDVLPALARQVSILPLPKDVNVLVAYPIAVLRSTKDRALAERFQALVCSARGHAVLARHGMSPARAAVP